MILGGITNGLIAVFKRIKRTKKNKRLLLGGFFTILWGGRN